MKKYVWFYQFPIGKIGVAEDGEGITAVFLADTMEDSKVKCYEEKETKRIQRAAKELAEYFQGTRKEFEIEIHPTGTPFQEKIWNILCSIPYGETRSYEQVAISAGNKNACRAVGMANHNNPIMLIIPCHRVVGKNGNMTGYAGGIKVKEQLLELEKNNK